MLELGAFHSEPPHVVAYEIEACRAEALAKAGAQIFFQPGEGAFKGVGVHRKDQSWYSRKTTAVELAGSNTA